MRLYYRDQLFDAQLLRTVGHSCYGGADIAECLATARRIRETNTSEWFTAWMALADRVRADAERSLRDGHTVSAREGLLRASNYYRNAYIFLFGLFGEQVNVELPRAYELHRQSFRQAAALMGSPVEEVRIPYEQTSLRGYFLRAGSGDVPRSTLILNGGYDSTAEECYFWNAVAALRRGYHCLIFDGPGQGSALIEDGLKFRPDWEAVIRPVVDWLLRQPLVDSRRIGLIGLSFGGYLTLRAASGEPRIAACVKKPTAGWGLRRGLWVHGAASIEEYLRLAAGYTLAGRVEQIQCPTLVCFAEDDDIAVSARRIYDALTCEKEFLSFHGNEGAGEHCEAGARLLFHQRAFDWLDKRLQRTVLGEATMDS